MASLLLCLVLLMVMASSGEPVSTPTCDLCDARVPTANCSNNYRYFQGTTVLAITCNTSHLLGLDMSQNNLNVLGPRAFQNLVTLQELWLDHANVRQVNKNAFHNLKELRKLDLSLNYIEVLHSETFQYLKSLQELHLRGNPLKVLANNIFSGLKSLTTLDLRGCELASISGENFRGGLTMPSSSLDEEASVWPGGLHIDVSDNPLSCDCGIRDFHALVTQSHAYDELTCAQPTPLRGYPLHVLDSADLNCKPYEILFPLRNTTFLAPSGQNFTLSCRITNDPHLPWLKRWTVNAGKSNLPETSPRFVISSSNMWLNLTIERVRPSDEGIYTCEVYNREDGLTTYRKVSLVVFEDVEYFPGVRKLRDNNRMYPYLIVGFVVLATFLSVAVFLLAAFRRKREVCARKKTVLKKSRDFMISVPFYASADGLLPSRSLPKRPGSEVLPWWLEYPEHLYEEVDSANSLANHTKPTAQPGEGVQYDRDHYVRPAGPREAESNRKSSLPRYATVLPDEG